MNPNNPNQPEPTPTPVPEPIAVPSPESTPASQPIADVVPPPTNSMPQGATFSEPSQPDISSNPIAGTSAASSGVIHDQQQGQAIDNVLSHVSTSVKAETASPVQPKKEKRGLFGGKKPKPTPAPQTPAANPIQQQLTNKPPKAKKPILPIFIALLAAAGLSAAAIMAF